MNTNIVAVGLTVLLLVLPGCGNLDSGNAYDPATGDGSDASDADANFEGTSCGDSALLAYNCWTSRFPADIHDKGDVTCSFVVSCCGKDLGNGWDTTYPKIAGLRGFVDNGSVVSPASCKQLDPLDVDGDDTPNNADSTPFGSDWKPWDAKATEGSSR
jgi:hypothetical protein